MARALEDEEELSWYFDVNRRLPKQRKRTREFGTRSVDSEGGEYLARCGKRFECGMLAQKLSHEEKCDDCWKIR